MQYDSRFFQQRLEHQLVIAGGESITEAERKRRRPRISLRVGRKLPPAESTKPSLAARIAVLSRQVQTLAVEAARTAGPLPVPEKVPVAQIQGRTLWAPAADWKRVSYYMLSAGLDQGLARFLRSIVSPGADFIDLGAGLGAYTLVAAALVTHGAAHAFEGDAETYDWLVSNLSGVGDRIRTYPLRVESLPALLRDIAASGRPAAIVRIGGDTILLNVLAAVEEAFRAHRHCRVVIEYCAALHGSGVARMLVEEAARLGFTARRISCATGEVKDLRPEDLDSAFSLYLLLDRQSEDRWNP